MPEECARDRGHSDVVSWLLNGSKAFKVCSKFDGGHGVSIGENPCLDPDFWCVLHRAFQSHVCFMITQRNSSIPENTDKTYQNMLSNCCPTVVQLLSTNQKIH